MGCCYEPKKIGICLVLFGTAFILNEILRLLNWWSLLGILLVIKGIFLFFTGENCCVSHDASHETSKKHHTHKKEDKKE